MYPSDVVTLQTEEREAALQKAIQARKVDLKAAFRQPIYDKIQRQIFFAEIFNDNDETNVSDASSCSISTESDDCLCDAHNFPVQRVLVIFIRHFFCGLCQEYLGRLAANPSLQRPELMKHNIKLAIIGCGAPSLIESYQAVTGIPAEWQIYADPSTELYRIFGTHSSYSLGDRTPKYIQRSMISSTVRSMVQVVKRIPEGDILTAGNWNVQGGEFLFERDTSFRDAKPSDLWELKWWHRMLNSRDHTEVDALLKVLSLPADPCQDDHYSTARSLHARTQSTPVNLGKYEPDFEKPGNVTSTRQTTSSRKFVFVHRSRWMRKSSTVQSNLNQHMSTALVV